MSLADVDLHTYSRQGPRCVFERLFDVLDPDDADTLRGWLDDPDVPGTSIARALQQEGHRVGGSTVGRHRRGDCRCVR